MSHLEYKIKRVIFVFLAFVTMIFFAACAKSGDSQNSNIDPNCPNCQLTPGTILAEAVAVRSDSVQSIEIGLRITSANQITPANLYSGPVQGQGYLRVSQNSPGACSVLPPGDYTIRNLGANGDFNPPGHLAVWNLTQFQFEIVNGAGQVARVRVNYANFSNRGPVTGADGLIYGHSMYGELQVRPVNYMPNCGQLQSTIFFPKESI